MSFWGPYVRMASHGIHAGPRGGYFDLGLPEGLDAIPARPSHFGLADPGANALISLGQATVALLSHCIRLQWDEDAQQAEAPTGGPELAAQLVGTVVLMARMKALVKLVDHGASLFVDAQNELEKEPPSSSVAPPVCRLRIEGLPKYPF